MDRSDHRIRSGFPLVLVCLMVACSTSEVRKDSATAANAASTSIPKPPLSADELSEQSAEMARLAAEIERQQALFNKRPKRKFISASTQQPEYAEYMRSWVEKVEHVGNQNYPDEARRQGLGGRLIMTVSVGRDGAVRGVQINVSSGSKLLDDAAIQVVQLAEPFSPLPLTKEDIDILEITRTWDYRNGEAEVGLVPVSPGKAD